MRMRRLIAVLLLLASALACNASVSDIVVGSAFNCPDGVALDQFDLYTGEEFYLCGSAYLNGVLLPAGKVDGVEANVMKDETMIVNGVFSLYGKADVVQHKYYYIDLSLKQPCEKQFEEVPIEVKTSCVMVPPSTIEAVPDIIDQGQRFTLEVKNAPTDVRMEINGLANPITALISRGGSWSQGFASNECSTLGSCLIHFEFTDQKHELCTAKADVVVTVKAPQQTGAEEDDDNVMLAIATLFVLVVGTGGAILLNRYL